MMLAREAEARGGKRCQKRTKLSGDRTQVSAGCRGGYPLQGKSEVYKQTTRVFIYSGMRHRQPTQVKEPEADQADYARICAIGIGEEALASADTTKSNFAISRSQAHQGRRGRAAGA